MERPILTLPHPILRRVADPVETFDETLLALCADLLDTMHASSHSVGVAAPQIGVSRQVFCVDVTGHKKAESCHGALVLVNPEVVAARDPVLGREGCMSVPNLTGDVVRPSEVVFRFRTPEGDVRVIEANAFEARALLHEHDHLLGKLFLDRVVSAKHLYRRKTYK